jgi:hypothetical protein
MTLCGRLGQAWQSIDYPYAVIESKNYVSRSAKIIICEVYDVEEGVMVSHRRLKSWSKRMTFISVFAAMLGLLRGPEN